MENNKQRNKILICLICLFALSLSGTIFVGFSGNVEQSNVKVKSVTPEYDESSTITMNGNDVKFNDKDQEVKYKVVLENTEGHNLTVSSVDLTTPTESFLSYTIENLKKDDVINANSTKEVTVTLKTTATEGWGRNFNDELTANITFAKNLGTGSTNGIVGSPETGDGIVLTVLIVVTSATGLAILIISKKKFVKYMILILMLSPALTLVKADTTIQLPITIKASFESQNVMKASGCVEQSGRLDNCNDYWAHNRSITKFYINNEITDIEGAVHTFDVSADGSGRVKAYLVESPNNYICYDVSINVIPCYDLYLQADGIIYANENSSYYFANMVNLGLIENIEGMDVSKVTNMRNMFSQTAFETSISLDLGTEFDTSNVTDMSGMFNYAGYMGDNVTLNLGDKFDTSKVTNMRNMFSATGYSSNNFTLDLGDKFDTNNVTNMEGMFSMIANHSSVFTLDLGDKFNTSNVTNMSNMFGGVGSSNNNFTLDLGDKFDTSNVTDMSAMFSSTGSSNSIFTLDLGDKFDTSNVTDMSSMFSGVGHEAQELILNLGYKFNTSKVIDMSYMFSLAGYNSSKFTFDLGDKFDTSKVTDMSYMFGGTGYNASNLHITIAIMNPDLTDYEGMFLQTATNEESEIILNYTTETESIVDNIIAETDPESNVKKGVNIDG